MNGSSRDDASQLSISGYALQHWRLASSICIIRSQSRGTDGGEVGAQMRFFSASSANVDSTNPMNAALNVGWHVRTHWRVIR